MAIGIGRKFSETKITDYKTRSFHDRELDTNFFYGMKIQSHGSFLTAL